MPHAFNPRTLNAETGGFSGLQSQPGLQSEIQESQDSTEKPCLKKAKQFITIKGRWLKGLSISCQTVRTRVKISRVKISRKKRWHSAYHQSPPT